EGSALDGLRDRVSGGGLEVEEAWGAVAAGNLVVAVMTAAPGDHGGVDALAGPFEGDRAIEVPWNGPAPHVAGWQEGDGVHARLLAAELPDGRLAVLSLSGPSAAFEDGELEASLSTVRLTG